MKKLFLIPLLALLVACNNNSSKGAKLDLDNFEHRISYALGADMGVNFTNIPEDMYVLFDKEQLELGFMEMLTNDEETSKDCMDILRSAFSNPEGIDTNEYSMDIISHCYGSLSGESLRTSLTSINGMDKVNTEIIKLGFSDALNFADTLIETSERQKMIIDFNNDLNKIASNDFIDTKKKEFKNNVKDEGYILVENKAGNGTPIELQKEYSILYTVTKINGDTLLSTVSDPNGTEDVNAQFIGSDDFVMPDVWRIASVHMEIGGDYTIYAPYDLGFGEEGLRSANSPGFIIKPYSAIVIHTKVFEQNELNHSVKSRGAEVLEEAKRQPNTYVDESGFVLTTLQEGTGAKVPKGGDVQAHYILMDSRGEVIENSYMNAAQYNQPPPKFSLGGVVEGWQLGIPHMKVGGRYVLTLPYDLGYGEHGTQGIPGYETLTFEIEILDAGNPGTLVQGGGMGQGELTPEQMEALQRQMMEQMGN